MVQALVSHRTMGRLLGDDSPRSLALATLFGVASSSCSYAAVALARSIFRKGASFTAAMVFELASTNLVVELGVILAVLMGWQFTAAEFAGGILMVILIALIFRLTLTPRLVEMARQQAERGALGRMEGHAAMDMAVEGGGSFASRLLSRRGYTAVSHLFVMDWASVWVDVVAGFLIAGALAAWVPEAFWQHLFLVDHPTLAKLEGPLLGPLVAIVSFVCSVGNVPLAAVLWRGGISFGGVVSFIFADLIVLPVLDIYRRYYGGRVALYILATFYVDDGRGGLRGGARLRGPGPDPQRPLGRGDRAGPEPELHRGAECPVPGARGGAGRALPAHRRPGDAADDGRAWRAHGGGRRPRRGRDGRDAPGARR